MKNLKRVKETGVILRKEKCASLRDEVFFLGSKLNKERIQPVLEEIEAIRAASNPQYVSQRKSFLGMLNFYSSFLPNVSAKLAPLLSTCAEGCETETEKGRAKVF
ncbi:transposon ty3-i Gag-Pol polyprotein [Plakobranchus ocellatus]|uniref:Transposon ty3-i Gag-Pol polyprotein n=1 Tax=Plakobranchus ocellatus TaxID=259542 RepID=A0AAV3ZI37_9GAST|nr:transposon ty3-i Gag-Pol polyprotein [Plakobranchus ocellatus]